MEENKNLKDLTKKISADLYNAISLSDILEEIFEGERKEELLISLMQNYIHTAFNNIEECRKLTASTD